MICRWGHKECRLSWWWPVPCQHCRSRSFNAPAALSATATTPAVCLMPPANLNGVAKLDRSLSSTTTVGSALRFPLMGLMWLWYSSARWVLWVDGLCAIQNTLNYLMFYQ